MVPAKAAKLMAKSPIPLVPFGLWRGLFIKMANQFWRQQAATIQLDQEDLLARPYAAVGSRDPDSYA
jgi:hypothetical protein